MQKSKFKIGDVYWDIRYGNLIVITEISDSHVRFNDLTLDIDNIKMDEHTYTPEGANNRFKVPSNLNKLLWKIDD